MHILPAFRDELLAYRASLGDVDRPALVFGTGTGGRQSETNVRRRILAPAVDHANAALGREGLEPLPEGLTPHSLRRTFASILVALREDLSTPRGSSGTLTRPPRCGSTPSRWHDATASASASECSWRARRPATRPRRASPRSRRRAHAHRAHRGPRRSPRPPSSRAPTRSAYRVAGCRHRCSSRRRPSNGERCRLATGAPSPRGPADRGSRRSRAGRVRARARV